MIRFLHRNACRTLDAGFSALAMFAGICVVLGSVSPAYRLNGIWVGGGGRGGVVDLLALFLAIGVGLTTWGRGGRGLRRVTSLVTMVFAALCLRDVLTFYGLVARGAIASSVAFPLSLGAVLVLGWGAARVLVSRRTGTRRGRMVRMAMMLPVLVLAHVLSFGTSDYRRPADAAVVFGAAVRGDGEPSLALRDRTETACDLYHQGLVSHLVLSGGRDPQAPLSEPACMAQIARARGVPLSALVLDERGLTTRASLDELSMLAQKRGWSRFLVVSHDYHLARIAMAADRRGLRAFTVPARQSRPWHGKSVFVVRELAALLWYAATDV